VLKKNIWANFQRIMKLFYQKNCQKALKNMVLGSGIRKKHIPDPGSRGQKGTGSRILDPDPQHWLMQIRIPLFPFDADRYPVPTSHIYAEPDPTFHFDASPDPDPVPSKVMRICDHWSY
jgi:hypothetical protein